MWTFLTSLVFRYSCKFSSRKIQSSFDLLKYISIAFKTFLLLRIMFLCISVSVSFVFHFFSCATFVFSIILLSFQFHFLFFPFYFNAYISLIYYWFYLSDLTLFSRQLLYFPSIRPWIHQTLSLLLILIISVFLLFSVINSKNKNTLKLPLEVCKMSNFIFQDIDDL